MSLARARFLGFTRSQLAVPFRRHASSGHGEGHASFPKEGQYLYALVLLTGKQLKRN